MSKRTKSRVARFSRDPLLGIKNRLRGTNNPIGTISLLRRDLDPSVYTEFLAWLHGNTFLSRKAFHPSFPASLLQLKQHSPFTPVGLGRELRWAAGALHPYAAALSEFVSLSTTFQQRLLAGNYTSANGILDEIHNRFGYSLWLIKNRIALLQEADGLEAQKAYVQRIRTESAEAGVVPYIAYYVSIRNEPLVAPSRYYERVRQELGKLAAPGDFVQYLAHHITPGALLPPSAIEAVLRHEHAGTIIDAYEAFLIAARIILSTPISAQFPALRSAVGLLRGQIEDSRLEMIFFELTGQPPAAAISKACTTIVELNLRGAYRSAFSAALDELSSAPNNVDLIMTAAKAAALLPDQGLLAEKTLGRRILSAVTAVMARTDEADKLAADLTKLSINYHGMHWADALLAFVNAERSPTPLPEADPLARFAAAGVPEISPLRVSAIPEPTHRMHYARLLADRSPGRLSTQYAIARAGEPLLDTFVDELVPEERWFLEAEINLSTHRLDQALAAAEELCRSAQPFFRRWGVRFQCECLLRLKRIPDCVRVMTAAFVDDESLHEILPIAEAVTQLDQEGRDAIAAEPLLAIAYDLYTTFISPDEEQMLRFAYEDFLSAHGLARPSELADHVDQFDRKQIVYFLSHIARENVMDLSLAFTGSRAVAEERLAICRLLAEIDPDRKELYEAEIRDIVRRILLNRQLRHVEQSKIYVDRDGIWRTATSQLRESYERYTVFLRHGLNDEWAAYNASVQEKGRAGDIDGLVGLPLPKSETSAQFRTLFTEIRDEYVSNSAHGLDGYLSLRIRHGTLSGQLRSPIEGAHLITPRDTTTDTYQRNKYWIERLRANGSELSSAVNECLVRFARGFDQLVNQILTEWIQVKRQPGDKGLFNFTLDDHQLALLSSYVTPDTPFDEFLAYALHNLDQLLELNLSAVRERIEGEAKTRVNELLTKLQEDITALPWTLNTGELHDAIGNARTGAQVTFDRVRDWFRLPSTTADEPFTIEDAVHVGAESIRTTSRSIAVTITTEGTENRRSLKGIILPVLVDVFFTIFENVVRHSGLPGPTWHVDIQIQYSDDAMRCRVVNKIAPIVFTDAARTRIEAIESAVREAKYMSAVGKEGGTGLFKVAKVLTYDLRTPPHLAFGFADSEHFFVEFMIPALMFAT